MTSSGNYNSQHKLEQGKSYPFVVVGKVKLEDERSYFILEDPNHIRHLLPSWYYSAYGIRQGQTVDCLVDKINCTGRLYLEPEHPHYSKGGVYDFPLHKVQKNETQIKSGIILSDIFGNNIEMECTAEIFSSISALPFLQCTVAYIRKGKPALVLSGSYDDMQR